LDVAVVPAVSLNHDFQVIKAGINYEFESGVATEAEPSGTVGSDESTEELAKKSQEFYHAVEFCLSGVGRPKRIL
jgi:hypothetical protein